MKYEYMEGSQTLGFALLLTKCYSVLRVTGLVTWQDIVDERPYVWHVARSSTVTATGIGGVSTVEGDISPRIGDVMSTNIIKR